MAGRSTPITSDYRSSLRLHGLLIGCGPLLFSSSPAPMQRGSSVPLRAASSCNAEISVSRRTLRALGKAFRSTANCRHFGSRCTHAPRPGSSRCQSGTIAESPSKTTRRCIRDSGSAFRQPTQVRIGLVGWEVFSGIVEASMSARSTVVLPHQHPNRDIANCAQRRITATETHLAVCYGQWFEPFMHNSRFCYPTANCEGRLIAAL